jgi:exosortase
LRPTPRSPLRAALARGGRLPALGPSLALALGGIAYRSLLPAAPRLPGRREVEQWFFAPEEESPLLAIAIAGWLLWRRRERLHALPDRGARATALALLAVGVGFFAWARLTGEASLLLPSLAANLLAFAGAAKGRGGCRTVLLPALVLLLGVPIPAPIRDELVWRLQLWTARGATWLMHTAGSDAVLAGVVMRHGPYAFAVIESCSGLRGIEILTLVALAVRELFAASGWRAWLVVLLAPWLGFGLNLLRVVAVVALVSSSEPEAVGPQGWDHPSQGVAVLVAGIALLYAFGRWTAGRGWRAAGPPRPAAAPERERPPERGGSPEPGRLPERGGSPERGKPPERGGSPVRLGPAVSTLALLAALSVALRPFPGAPQLAPIELPEQLAGWSGEDLTLDRSFLGSLSGGQALHRLYQKKVGDGPPQLVEVLVGYQVAESPGSRLFSPKLARLGHDWSLDASRPARISLLGLEAELAVASRDSERALVYTWRLRDEGLWRETSRAALALESGPFRRERHRAVVRLATPLPDEGPVAHDRAQRTLDAFVSDFREALAGL